MSAQKHFTLLAALAALAAVQSPAQWVQLGPPGVTGSVTAIAKSSTGLVAGSRGGGVSVSNDGGNSWTSSNVGMTNLNVTALAALGGSVFASTAGGGVFVSTDGGANWGTCGPIVIPHNILISTNVNTIQAVGTTLFAGPDNYGVFLSTDRGVTWYPGGSGLATAPVNAFIGADTVILAGTNTQGIFKTTDGGVTWGPANNGLTETQVMAFCTDGPRIFAATFGGGVFVSTDLGSSWSPANGGLTNGYMLCLAVLPGTGGSTIFAGTLTAGLFRSTDHGSSWIQIPLQMSENTASALLISGTSVYLGTRDGLLASSDGGNQWRDISSGFIKSTVNGICFAGDSVVAGTPGGVYKSGNRGLTWSTYNQGLKRLHVTSVASTGSTIAAGTDSSGAGLMVRGAGDAAWRGTSLIDPISVVAVAGNTFMAAPSGKGVFVSTNGGSAWTFGVGTEPGLDGNFVEGLAAGGGYMYAASNGKGAYISADGGFQWVQRNNGMKDFHAHACVVSGGTAYLATAAGVFSTTDRESWIPCNTGLENYSVTSMAAAGGILFAGTANAGVFVSVDSGAHWKASNRGLSVPAIRCIATDGLDVYVGTAGGGTCRRSVNELIQSLGVPLAIGGPDATPSNFTLSQNYPNPFNPSTEISFTLPAEGFVTLTIFDALGREVERLIGERMVPGTHTVRWSPRAATGVYIYRIVVTGGTGREQLLTASRAMLLLR